MKGSIKEPWEVLAKSRYTRISGGNMGDRCMLRGPSGLGRMKQGVLQSFGLDKNECL